MIGDERHRHPVKNTEKCVQCIVLFLLQYLYWGELESSISLKLHIMLKTIAE